MPGAVALLLLRASLISPIFMGSLYDSSLLGVKSKYVASACSLIGRNSCGQCRLLLTSEKCCPSISATVAGSSTKTPLSCRHGDDVPLNLPWIFLTFLKILSRGVLLLMVLTKSCQHFGRASRCVLLAIALALSRATLFPTVLFRWYLRKASLFCRRVVEHSTLHQGRGLLVSLSDV